ncbi:MAG: glycoside hydrolase family 1 protein [Candidatus Melainabacteria bacterium HGW-Melainabacteria-1]|nr:MAG: glycoside hydrolase family 1 protein [Candidatus Melainabacteria bacterium HGW-Melainabacteria-1]
MRLRQIGALAGLATASGLALWWRRSVRKRPPAQAALPEQLSFPADFVWGAATSSYQVEGGIINDWSAAGLDAGGAVDHFRRYSEDFGHAARMGHNAHRLSLEWSRIEPAPGEWSQAALAHYRQVLRTLRAQGLQPFVTLWHFTQPIWFAQAGGWLNPENIQAYVRYVEQVMQALGAEADYWVTLNEPLVYAFQAYDEGRWPPFGHSRDQALSVASHLLLAHARAYRAIKALVPTAQVGLVKNMTVMDPLYGWDPLSRKLTRIQDWLFNEAIWQALTDGRLQIRLPGCKAIQLDDPELLKGALDFIGINYYTRFLIGPSGRMITRTKAPLTDLGWEIYTAGLLRVIQQAAPYAKALKVPIYITENGLADSSDSQRKAYLVQHLYALWQALEAGLPVKGYFHWSLIDNFEWADGYGYQFGLLDAHRQWRASADLYRDIICRQGFPSAWLQDHSL